MNSADLPLPASGATTAPETKSKIEPPVRLGRLSVGLALAVMIFDSCFWGIFSLGFSVPIFFLALSGIILINRESGGTKRSTQLILALLVGAATAGAFETGVTNIVILWALIVALAGNTFFTRADSFWGRWLSQGIALLLAPGRVFWLGARTMEAAFGNGVGRAGKIFSAILLTLPALVLALLFGSLLASGNAVFSSWTASFFDWFWKELAQFLDASRIMLWLVAAVVILPLLRPTMVADWLWRWTERIPRLPEIIPNRGAFFSSALVLLLLNLLFLVANVADLLFLWSGRAIPAGVTYSDYVHHGVNILLLTVILSAFVLTAIFQQTLEVSRRFELKMLALVWIGQNLFLLLSVTLRLKLYIEAYDMTVARLSLMIFLVLVAMGFGLLAVKILKERSLSWMIGGCVCAVFLTLYVTQFLDLKGWSAHYNVAAWEKSRSRNLDVSYLDQLGPAAWPALRRAHELAPNDGEITKVWEQDTSGINYAYSAGHKWRDWREFSLRAWMNRGALDERK
jgi:hypothetical protein